MHHISARVRAGAVAGGADGADGAVGAVGADGADGAADADGAGGARPEEGQDAAGGRQQHAPLHAADLHAAGAGVPRAGGAGRPPAEHALHLRARRRRRHLRRQGSAADFTPPH